MRVLAGKLDATGLRFGIVVGRFNDVVSQRLLEGALDALVRHGAAEDDITVAWVPGAFEIPLAAQALAAGEVDAVICLGVVIRGSTPHFDFVAGQCAAGVQRVALDTRLPISFGVLTTETLEQALDRAGGKSGNKGADAAVTAIEMISLLRMAGKRASPVRHHSG